MNWMGRFPLPTSESRVRLRKLEHQDDLAFNSVAGALTLERLADSEQLTECFRRLRNYHGQAPGIDGFSYRDLAKRDVCHLCRQLSQKVNQKSYHPSREKRLRQRKADGIGHRTLSLRGIMDRVLAKRATDLIERYFEPRFAPNSFGFRPRRGREHLLVRLPQEILSGNKPYLLITDIENAFDHVPIAPILKAISRHTQDRAFVCTVEKILRGGTQRQQGIDQGSPLSPLALNILLDRTLDRPFAAQRDAYGPLLRFADNLIVPTPTCQQAQHALQFLRALLNARGMTLKESATKIIDIRCETAEILGYTVGLQAGLVTIRISPTAWTDLRQGLEKARDAERPVKRAMEVAQGWMQAQGPAYQEEEQDTISNRVMEAILEAGHWECPPIPDLITRAWTQGYRHWQRIVTKTNTEPNSQTTIDKVATSCSRTGMSAESHEEAPF